MKHNLYCKILAVGIIVLFFGATVCPSIAGYEKVIDKKEINDYNNPIKYAIESGVLSNYSWFEQDKLLASDGAEDDRFCWSVCIDSDYAFIGAPYDSSERGSVYVFKRNGTTWTEEQKLLASDGAANDHFGRSVSIDGDYAFIGAPFDDTYTGSVYVFKCNGTTWTEEQKLRASDSAEGDDFGWSVSFDGHSALIGAIYGENDRGAGYVFIKGNQPPNAPNITGPPQGKPGVEYTYCVDVFDPDDDNLHVLWEWGDGTSSDWLGPFESGEEICDSHIWNDKGDYIITVTLRDEHGAMVTADLEISIPRNRVSIGFYWCRFLDMFPILQKILLTLWN